MDENKGALDRLIDGGLPQIIAGPAGKAISRLIGASVDIPVEWLAGISQGMRDKRKARTRLSQLITERAAQDAVENPVLMERALQSLLGREYRRQQNKEAVAVAALEQLAIRDNVAAPQSEPSDDWMNLLERAAEDASSSNLREMFGLLLAEEIQTPGAVSKASLHMVSVLDVETAQLIERTLPYCDSSGICYLDYMEPKLNVADTSLLENVGFWSTGKSLPFQEVVAVFKEQAKTVVLHVQPPEKGRLRIALLSRAGQDLRRAVPVAFDHHALAQHLHSLGASDIKKVTVRVEDNEEVHQIEYYTSDSFVSYS